MNEIEQLTLKGIQPTIDRLTRRHKEDCEEIHCNTKVSRQKLEVQCEDELLSRISEFQRSEQVTRSDITSRNDFSGALLIEQNEQVVRMKKLKESLTEEEVSTKKLHEMELQTLSKRHEAELAKSTSSNTIHHLEENLQYKLNQRRHELKGELEQMDRKLAISKKEWEDAYRETLIDRQEKRKDQQTKELLAWRETQINNLIRANVQARLESETMNSEEFQMESDELQMEAELESLRAKLSSARDKNSEIKAKLVSMSNSRKALQSNLSQIEEDFDSVSIKVDDANSMKERKQRHHEETLAELSRQTDCSLESIRRRQEECKLEVDRTREKMAAESRWAVLDVLSFLASVLSN